MRKIFSKSFPAICWTIIIQVLLCLPGTKIPGVGHLELPQIDKLAHIVLFGAFVGLWCYYLYSRNRDINFLKKWFFIVFLISVVNGIMMEYVQFYLISDRSFDQGDIIADLIASGIAYGICNIKLLKTSR